MRIAITGTTGRVGRALCGHFSASHEVVELPRNRFELSPPDFADRIRSLDFDLLLNPAALTSLEVCEDEPELARRVNAEAPAELALICRENGRRMLHFSTDYVLGGATPGLHDEASPIGPASVYARTKYEAEQRVLDQGGCVVRVSWVFGPERPAFPDQVIRRALAGEPLSAVSDKTSLPTFTRDLAGWIEGLVSAGVPNELVHACNRGEPTSWHGMAEVVVDELVERGALDERPEIGQLKLSSLKGFKALRPRHTAMATDKLTRILGRPPRDWREAIREHVAEHLICR